MQSQNDDYLEPFATLTLQSAQKASPTPGKWECLRKDASSLLERAGHRRDLLGDKGYDAKSLRKAPNENDTGPDIPGRSKRKVEAHTVWLSNPEERKPTVYRRGSVISVSSILPATMYG